MVPRRPTTATACWRRGWPCPGRVPRRGARDRRGSDRAGAAEAGQRLGVALAPIVGALDLAEVVLSGPEELLEGALLGAVRTTLDNRTMAGFHSATTIRMTSQGRDIVLRGCVIMVMSAQLGVSWTRCVVSVPS